MYMQEDLHSKSQQQTTLIDTGQCVISSNFYNCFTQCIPCYMYIDGEPPCDKLKTTQGEITTFRFLQPQPHIEAMVVFIYMTWLLARANKMVATAIATCYFGTVK